GLKEILPAEFKVTLTGTPRIIQLHMESFSRSQAISLAFSVLVVWSLVSLMFSSLLVGSMAMLPLFFTVTFSLGTMGILGVPLDAATVLVASISVGVGIDYAIHFIERVRSELKMGLRLQEASSKASRTAGHALLVNAATLISGFAVLAFSRFLTVSVFGLLMIFTMAISSMSTLVIIPAILSSSRLESKLTEKLSRKAK
ncbi:MAG TPA: hypothetical protein ENN47_03985, partial [Mesotoga infera]|nr:hypothetical protein [Mesotoga infera]